MDKEAGALSLGDIESGLERLMPRGLTDSAREDLESVVDELANSSSVASFWRARVVWLSSSAALLFAALGGMFFSGQSQRLAVAPRLAQLEPSEEGSGLEILEQVTWISGGADLGVQVIDDSGEVSRGWSYVGVEEERILHESSGYEVILQRDFEAEMYASSSL